MIKRIYLFSLIVCFSAGCREKTIEKQPKFPRDFPNDIRKNIQPAGETILLLEEESESSFSRLQENKITLLNHLPEK